PPPLPTLFPYTTLFRSLASRGPRRSPRAAPAAPAPAPADLPHPVAHLAQEPRPRAARPRGDPATPGEPVRPGRPRFPGRLAAAADRKSTRLNSSHLGIS